MMKFKNFLLVLDEGQKLRIQVVNKNYKSVKTIRTAYPDEIDDKYLDYELLEGIYYNEIYNRLMINIKEV